MNPGWMVNSLCPRTVRFRAAGNDHLPAPTLVGPHGPDAKQEGRSRSNSHLASTTDPEAARTLIVT